MTILERIKLNSAKHPERVVMYPLSECSGWTGDIIAVAS